MGLPLIDHNLTRARARQTEDATANYLPWANDKNEMNNPQQAEIGLSGQGLPGLTVVRGVGAIEHLQKKLDLHPDLLDFYNMAMQRPNRDPWGYCLLFVDASHKCGLGRRSRTALTPHVWSASCS